MNYLTIPIFGKELKEVFDKHKYLQPFPKVHHIMSNNEVLSIYLVTEELDLEDSVYDYMLWLRKVRKELYPDCPYKVCRKKTPKYEHSFKNLSISDFLRSLNKHSTN